MPFAKQWCAALIILALSALGSRGAAREDIRAIESRAWGEYAITSRDAPLYPVPDASARSDSYIEAMTIVRLDALVNGFVRLSGCEWFLPYNCVDNIAGEYAPE
ncbi:MAG: hypothetical protein LBH66_02610 [Oscillospiraceae bacterium]|nr:hypothetical protein [Oscillospiraceae bacterium]